MKRALGVHVHALYTYTMLMIFSQGTTCMYSVYTYNTVKFP